MSRNYIACRLCRWMIRAHGRRTDPDRAFARLSDHMEYAHREEAERIGAAAVPVALHRRAAMSHHLTSVHAHGPHRSHDDPLHIKHIMHRAVAEAKRAGYEIVGASHISDGGEHDLHAPRAGESGEHTGTAEPRHGE